MGISELPNDLVYEIYSRMDPATKNDFLRTSKKMFDKARNGQPFVKQWELASMAKYFFKKGFNGPKGFGKN